MQTCLLCPRKIFDCFYFCFECGALFNLLKPNGKFKRPTDMPNWAHYLYNDEVRWRRLNRNIIFFELSLEELEDLGYQAPDKNNLDFR